MNWPRMALMAIVLGTLGFHTGRLGGQEPAGAPEGKVIVQIRAIVNGEPIFDDEVRVVIMRELFQAQQLTGPDRKRQLAKIWRKGLDQLIDREVIFTEAKGRLETRPQVWGKLQAAAEKSFDRQIRWRKDRIGIESDQEFKAALEKQGLSFERMRRAAERQFIATEFVRSQIFPLVQKLGHKELRQYYEEHPAEFEVEDLVKWQDIFVDTAKYATRHEARQFAEDLAQRARQGADFAKLAVQYSDGDSSLRNGDGYGQRAGEIRPIELESVLFQMAEGDIGPVMEFPTGFHVIRVKERQYAGKRPFDAKTQEDIRSKLQNLIGNREYKRIVNDLKRKATIEILDSPLLN